MTHCQHGISHSKENTRRTGVVHTVSPRLAVWLGPFDRTDITRFAIVVPGQNFNHIVLTAITDHGLPALGVEVLVG